MKILALILALLVGGCSTVNRVSFQVAGGNPTPIDCEVVEARPSMLSTWVAGVCVHDGKPVGMVGGVGTSQAQVALSLAEMASMIAVGIVAPTILAKGLIKAGDSIEKPWPSRVCTDPTCASPDND